jgi:YgiT-type zinc finger domain-containing protein
MICLMCRRAEPVGGFTSVQFERGEFRLVVNGVPARVCPSCGEGYLEEAVAEQILGFARQRLEAGMLDQQCEYRTL